MKEEFYKNPVLTRKCSEFGLWKGKDRFWFLGSGALENILLTSENLVDWEETNKSPFTIQTLNSLYKLGGENHGCYVRQRENGEYLMYLSLGSHIVVLVSDKPEGPYVNLYKDVSTYTLYSGRGFGPKVYEDWIFWSAPEGIYRQHLDNEITPVGSPELILKDSVDISVIKRSGTYFMFSAQEKGVVGYELKELGGEVKPWWKIWDTTIIKKSDLYSLGDIIEDFEGNFYLPLSAGDLQFLDIQRLDWNKKWPKVNNENLKPLIKFRG